MEMSLDGYEMISVFSESAVIGQECRTDIPGYCSLGTASRDDLKKKVDISVGMHIIHILAGI
jgi:hypothetical protein